MSVEAQVALVHGGGVYPTADGYRLERGSEARTDHAVALLQAGHVEGLLFTGGNAHGDDLGGVSEAGLMADRAVFQRVPASQITIEDVSSSTIGNWANSAVILERDGVESVLGVTSRIAAWRAEWIGRFLTETRGLPLEVVRYSTSHEPEGVRAVPREMMSMVMSRQCLYKAYDEKVELPKLDEFYRAWKAQYRLGHVKRVITGTRAA
jgi:uncharacterized SAM-binding protein YcdF (DUF218 family)